MMPRGWGRCSEDNSYVGGSRKSTLATFPVNPAGSIAHLRVELLVRQQGEMVHREAEFRERVGGGGVDAAGFHALLGAAETFGQRELLVGVAELEEETAQGVGLA